MAATLAAPPKPSAGNSAPVGNQVVTAQYLPEKTRQAAFAPDAEFLEDPPSEVPRAPPGIRNRPAQSAESLPSQAESSAATENAADDRLPGNQVRIPLDDSAPDEEGIELTPLGDRITLVVRDQPLSTVLNLLAKMRGLNVIIGDDTDKQISVTLTNVDFNEAWSAIVEIAGCTWTQANNIIMVSSVSGKSKTSPQIQDRQVRVFPLNFVDAKDVENVVKELLSPAGKVFTMQTSPKERRSTQETVIVEDMPAYLNRAAEYIATIDVPPRQVMIEVHILQIELDDNCVHGVNLEYLFGAAGNDVVMSTVGFANPAAATASLFTVTGAHFNSVIQALQNTTDSKTLASPKVIVANGQQARIQIGQRFGYFVTTTTQTSTLQNVNFLNTGVVLSVTPQISADNQVLMSVTPEVSTGQITNGLPQTETTTTDTTVLLPDGCGMVIGGLIKETDIETQAKVPILGDLRVIGRLFQQRTVTRQRVEIIIALLPRIAPYPPGYEVQHQMELEQAFTPLMQGPLNRAPRPLEAKLPDAYTNPRNLRLNRLPDAVRNLKNPYPLPVEHFFPTAQEEYPPVLPPPPVPLPNLSLPPMPAPAPLPPVDVIIPDAAEAAQPAPVKAAKAKSAKARSAKGLPVKRKLGPAQPLPTGPPSRRSSTSDPEATAGKS
jgi:Flp pilus assembly secretin CpaC